MSLCATMDRGSYEAEYEHGAQKRINRVVFGRERVIWLPDMDGSGELLPQAGGELKKSLR